MIEHTVLLKFKEGTSEEDLGIVIKSLRGLKEKIPQLVETKVGRNISDRGQGFQIGVSSQFESQLDLDEYLVHKEHVNVVQKILKPILADIIVVDYNI
jgi:hypothetical protein